MNKIRMDENGVEALKNLANLLPEAVHGIDESAKQLRESFEQNKELLGPHSTEIETILASVDEAQKIGNKSVLRIQKKLIAAAVMLAAIIDKEMSKSTPDAANNDVNVSNIMKGVADQNVTKSVLPKNGTWSEPSKPGNSAFVISDDAQVKWTKGESYSCTGKELKEWMESNYGTSTVTYDHKEPDFTPFADKSIGKITVDKMSTSRTGGEGTFEYATRIAAERKGMSIDEFEKYMKDNQLTWHECADRHTILAVPTRINSTYKHSGGISVQKSVETIGNTIHEQLGGNDWTLVKEGKPGTADKSELEAAIKRQRERFKEKKKDLFGRNRT